MEPPQPSALRPALVVALALLAAGPVRAGDGPAGPAGSAAAGVAALAAGGVLILALRRQVVRRTLALRDQLRRELDLEAEHKDLIENANDVIFTLDRDNRITSFNRAGERLTGFSRGEVIGRLLSELAAPGGDPAPLARSANGSQTFELVVRTRDGRTAVWEVSARPAKRDGVLAATNCIARDVTERKRAHEELRRLYLIQAQQFEHSPLAFIEWDGQFRVVRWSRQAERIFGWAAEEAVGKTYDELGLIHEADADLVRATAAELAGGYEFNTCRNRNYTRARQVVHVEWYNSTLRDESGRLTCVISLAQDVTARVREEERRQQLEEQYRQAQKMEAVGRLAGGVAHDFNNLLTVINGCAELLLVESRPGEPARELAEEIQRAGEQAATLTRQLLAFGRRQITAPVVLDLNGVVRDVEKMLRRLIGEHIELLVDLDPAGARVKADPGLMVQLLMNLAVNARDAMPAGGTLTVRTEQAGNRVAVTVADTGVGMDEPTRARMFEPFFTTKPAGEGTGLGLATVRSIVDQSGGAIAVDSEPGRGTAFRIELPACWDRVASKDTAYFKRTELLARGTILLVEDEEMVRTLAQRVLEGKGYRVYAAACGADAVELHHRIPGKVDLLVTDVVMPGLGGRQLAERLRERQPGLKVLFMSGYTSDEVLRQGIQEEEVAFLQKPFRPDALGRKVREVLHAPADRAEPALA